MFTISTLVLMLGVALVRDIQRRHEVVADSRT